jgi:SSS family transporter
MSTETIIFIGVALYLVLMLGIGIYASRGSGTTEDFIVSGRRMPIWLCSATVVATWFGAGPMMGAAGASYEQGLLGVIADPFGGALVIFIVGFFFIRFFRRLGVLTVVDMLEMRFGTTAATIAAIGLIISVIGWAAAMLVAFGTVFNSMTGISLEAGIIAGAIVVFIYTAIGGMWAVALTDFVQMVIICVGLVILFVVVLGDVGGWDTVSAQFPENTFRMIPLENDAGVWLEYMRAWLIFGLADITSQTLMQRGLAARSEQVAQNSFYIGGALYLAFGMIPVLLGIIAAVTMPGLEDPASVIPGLALGHLHPVMIAIFVGALLAAIMSSTDSMLLSVSSILSTNLYPLVKPDAPDGERLLVARLAVPIAGTLAVVVALYVQLVYDLIQDANSPLLAVVVVPFIAGIWWRKANRTGVLAAMAAGFVVWISLAFMASAWPGDLLGMLACLATLLVVTPLTQSIDPPRPARDRRGEVVDFNDRLGVLPLFRRVGEDSG